MVCACLVLYCNWQHCLDGLQEKHCMRVHTLCAQQKELQLPYPYDSSKPAPLPIAYSSFCFSVACLL